MEKEMLRNLAVLVSKADLPGSYKAPQYTMEITIEIVVAKLYKTQDISSNRILFVARTL